MYSAANRLADFAGRDHVNSATETQTPLPRLPRLGTRLGESFFGMAWRWVLSPQQLPSDF